jgi:dihydroxyacetone kinase
MATITTSELERLARHVTAELAARGETIEVVRNMAGTYVAVFGTEHRTVTLGTSKNEAYNVLAALLHATDIITTTTTTEGNLK